MIRRLSVLVIPLLVSVGFLARIQAQDKSQAPAPRSSVVNTPSGADPSAPATNQQRQTIGTAFRPGVTASPSPAPSPGPSPTPTASPSPSPTPGPAIGSTVNPATPQSAPATSTGVPPMSGGGGGGMPMMPPMPMPAVTDGRANSELFGGDQGKYGAGGGVPDNRPVAARDLNGRYPIEGPFKKSFDKCLGEVGLGEGACKFENWGIIGDEAHKRRRSCHNTGEAIDVGPIRCGNTKYDAKHPKFLEMAKCMANNSEGKFKVLFHTSHPPNLREAPNHTGHMHIQLKECVPQHGR